MSPGLLRRVLPPAATPFVRAARARGVKARVARTLEPTARELAPHDPTSVFTSRQLFERVAMQAVTGDAGNLELSYRPVDELASAVEGLGLARASDVPDPFRRVWVQSQAGTARRGVVVRYQRGEVAVFCPPGSRAIAAIGEVVHLRYRGFSSSVEYELRLNDAVRLPGAHVLHLTRLDGQGSIGRDNRRFDVDLEGRVRAQPASADVAREPFLPCRVLDLSSGGLRLECSQRFERGRTLSVEVHLDDGVEQPFAARGEVRWAREPEAGTHSVGLLFEELTERPAERLAAYLARLAAEAGSPGDVR